MRPPGDAVFDNIRKKHARPADAEGTARAGEKLGPAGRINPREGKMLKESIQNLSIFIKQRT
jgi:hypothetical protein